MDGVRSRIDWERIEIDFRAGVKTLRQIGDEYGVSHVAVSRKAKKENWPRDLSAKIAAKARDKVTKASVNSEVTRQTERDVIEAESEVQSRIALGHRKDIPARRELVGKLFSEVEAITDGQELVAQLVEALESGDQEALARSAQRVSSLPSRIKGVSDLVTAYKTLILLERQAFGLGDTVEIGALAEGIRVTYVDAPARA